MIQKLKKYFSNVKQRKIEVQMKAGYGWAWAEFMVSGIDLSEISSKVFNPFDGASTTRAFDQGVELALQHMANQFGIQASTDLTTKPKVKYVPVTISGEFRFNLAGDTFESAVNNALRWMNNFSDKHLTWKDMKDMGYTIEMVTENG